MLLIRNLKLGLSTALCALVLAAWCIATAALMHFHPANKAEMIQFLKNLCMAGGLLQVMVLGAGRFSLDRH